MKLGPYVVLQKLGQGGMARVFLAEDSTTGALVVLKVLLDHLRLDETMRSAFRREAVLGRRLQHPGIVGTVDCVDFEGELVLVLEYVEGLTYGDLAWNRLAPLPLSLHVEVLRQLLTTLHDLHEAVDADGRALRVVHRDLSPQNLVVTPAGAVKLLDFGIARSTLEGGAVTAPGVFRGRLHYSSPERCAGAPGDYRADLFSVGVMLWEAWSQRRLWAGMAESEVLECAISGLLPPYPTDREPPAAWEAVLRRALAVDPQLRWGSAAEFAAALRELGADDGGAHQRQLASFIADHYGDWLATRRAEATEAQARLHELDDAFRPGTPSVPTVRAPKPGGGQGPGRRRRLWSWAGAGAAVALAGSAAFLALRATSPDSPRPAGTSKTTAPDRAPPPRRPTPEDLPPAAACADPFLIVDFEDGLARPCAAKDRGGFTYFYSDGTGETSPVPGLLTASDPLPVPRGTSRRGLHLRGSDLRDWAAGIAMILHDKLPVDLSRYGGITLWARSDHPGTVIGVRFATPATLDESYGGTCQPRHGVGCDDHYGARRTLTSEWTRFRVPFAEVRQGGWGVAAPFDTRRISELHVAIEPAAAGATTFNLWLDDVWLF